MKRKLILDSNAFDKIINLSDATFLAIQNKNLLATTNVTVKELNRTSDAVKREKFLKVLQHCEILNAKIFGFQSYRDGPVEDSLGGFSTYDSPDGGAMLSYQDAEVFELVPPEERKKEKGRSLNDTAMALVAMNHVNTVLVTNETRLLKKLGKRVISFEELLKDTFQENDTENVH